MYPTMPFVLSDNKLSDLHDNTKQHDATTIKDFNVSKIQILKNIQSVLT